MEVAKRVAALAAEMGIVDVTLVANKVRDDGDRMAISEFCAAHSLDLIGEIPYDASLLEAERAGKTPIDFNPDSPAVKAIEKLARTLDARRA